MVPNVLDEKVSAITLYIKNMTVDPTADLPLFQTSKDLCKSFIENNRDPILLLDLEATIVLANQAFSQLLDWRKDNLEGYHIVKCPPIPPQLVNQMKIYYQKIVNNKGERDTTESPLLETIRIKNEGKAHYMMLSITSIQDYSGKVCNWAVHLRDVTAQKEAEKKLLRAEKLLSIGEIAAGVTHEIRNPLTSLKGLTKLMKTEEIPNYKYLDVIGHEINQIESFIDEISLLAKIKVKPTKFADVNGIVQKMICLLEPHAIKNKVFIEYISDGLPEICCEETLLAQAFYNIMENGIESMPEGGRLKIKATSQKEFIRIHILDQGTGMPED
ncbi:PAS domain S-box protein [Alteribacillus sp. HJP-4]|uniref:PAS domain S-box protein n=1 Tax=Alteribacillus sp. HJP-4 TaxID=2775394 RepID=UPI0035CD25B6